MKKLVLILSAGERPWISIVEKMGRDYAERCGADFVIERNLPTAEEFNLPPLPDEPGRKNKLVYAAKAYLPWKYLSNGYDRVLMLDDSCCIKKNAASLFDLVPEGHTGLAPTGLEHGLDSFNFIENETRESKLPAVKAYNTEKYGNTGVVLYDKTALNALAPEKIIAARKLLFAKRPHQTLFYYLMQRGKVPISMFSMNFNRVPGTGLGLSSQKRRLLKDVKEFYDSKVRIYHVTGFFKYREKLIRSIASKFGYKSKVPIHDPGEELEPETR